MGRITTSFRMKLDETVSRIKTELLSLVIDERIRRNAENVIKGWYSEANALSNFSQPYLLGTLTLFSIFALRAEIEELNERLKKLEKELADLKSKV